MGPTHYADSVHFTHTISWHVYDRTHALSRAGAPAARGLEGTPLAAMALSQRSNGDRWGRLSSPRTPQQGGKPAWEATETAWKRRVWRSDSAIDHARVLLLSYLVRCCATGCGLLGGAGTRGRLAAAAAAPEAAGYCD